MLSLLPRGLPSLVDLLEDLGNPSSEKLARALHVTERTVRRWRRDGKAPFPAMLALYWVTRWGQSAASTHADWTLDVHRQLAESLQRENKELSAKLAALGRISDFGSANDPTPAVTARPVPSAELRRPSLAPDAGAVGSTGPGLWLSEAELSELLAHALTRARGFTSARRSTASPQPTGEVAAQSTGSTGQEPIEPTTVSRVA